MSGEGARHRQPSQRALAALWVALTLLWFLPLDTPHLFDPDEGRYAEIPREMLSSDDWVTPRLDAIKYFEKPALQYWATATAFRLFGEHAWSARLWPALCGFLGLLLTWWLARRLYDRRVAVLAVLVQASALLYLAMARIDTLDMGLSFTLQLAMTALVLLVGNRDSHRLRAPLLLGIGVALAVLSKGLVGILIPGAVAVLYMLLHRDWRLLLRAQVWWSLLALGVLAAPWFVLVSRRNPEFAHFFFVFQHFQRFVSRAGFDRYQPVWFFVPVLAVGLIPWTTFLPGALKAAWREARAGDRVGSLLLIWSLFIFTFFSISQSKLIPYILPVLPALSLLSARSMARLPSARFARHLLVVTGVAAVIAATPLVLWWLPSAAALVARASSGSIFAFILAFALLALGAACGAWLSRRGSMLAGAAAAALGSALLTQTALIGAEGLPRMQAVVQLEQHLRAVVDASTGIFCVNDYIQPIPFYLQRTCTLVGYRGELDFGLQQEPWLAIANLAAFVPVWQAQRDAVAILRPMDYQTLEALGAPMRVIYTAPSFVAVLR
jgi:4-amino-4-deoxy-L-arabinose transferase-like glycosyltransferase